MKNLIYVGGDDIRELTPSDLDRLGVENAEATLSFKQGRSLTVDDKVAEALIGRVDNVREATAEEMEAEIASIEAELGFAPYNPNDHSVAEVSDVLAASSEEKRKYILDQERAGQNRKGIFKAVGAEWTEKGAEPAAEEAPGEEESTEDLHLARAAEEEADLAAQAEDTAEAGATPQTTGDSGGPSGTANTSTSA
jgi:hypothetical protein